jgi:LacI family transcriptional regulator
LPTIRDVARRAGVSPATVSRVIQGARGVQPATREKVERAIAELGYVPSAVARGLRSKRTRSLALVVPDIDNSFWTTVARGVEDAAQAHDYSVFLCNTDENPAKQLRYLDVVIGQQVDGVIIAPYDSDARNLVKLRDRNIPTVIIDRRIEGWNVDSVLSDSVSGARALVQHLINLGHRCIAVISGSMKTSTAEDRVTGYCMALAEAGLSVDPRLIRRGEFLASSGEELTYQVLDEGLHPTAIFATNNAIAMGVIDAVGKRSLRVPQDIALVCFDDLPNVSHVFPFLTVVVQPAYDMGMNAAQLLLSRLGSEASLQPRYVTLPTRLIVRHSCGNRLRDNGDCLLSLPLPASAQIEESIMVKPLRPEERRDLSRRLDGLNLSNSGLERRLSDYDRSDVNRLLRVLQHQEADRVPHLELSMTSRTVYEYVLERELRYEVAEAQAGKSPATPEDQVEFALRLGMDAVYCDFSWHPNNSLRSSVTGSLRAWDDLEPAPSLVGQLSHLERYLRAAQGTGIGVIAGFSACFDTSPLAAVVEEALRIYPEERHLLEKLMDFCLEHQEKVMRVVCDRFADDLAFIMVSDGRMGLDADLLSELLAERMKRLIAPAKEHDKLLLMHTGAGLDRISRILLDCGFDAIYAVGAESDSILEAKRRWGKRLTFVGSVPTALLVDGSREEIEARVHRDCVRLAPGGGYVLGSSNGILETVPPENFVAMTRAVHKYGRYGSLGIESQDAG